MTEYEINKRLAEIAGVVLAPDPNELLVYRFGDDYPEHLKEWSPLTDWGQLGPLMERECVSASFDYDYPTAVGWVTQVYAEHDRLAEENHPDLKRAICLAIIAAYEEGTT